MAAPKNNTYWQNRKKHGRTLEFKTSKEFEQAWLDYFAWVDKNPWYKVEQLKKPTIVRDKNGNEKLESMVHIPTKRPYTEIGFCSFHGLGKNYINQLEKKLEEKPNKELSGVLSWARGICTSDKLEGAMVGAYNANIVARDLGLVDKTDLTTKGKEIQQNVKIGISLKDLSPELRKQLIEAKRARTEGQ